MTNRATVLLFISSSRERLSSARCLPSRRHHRFRLLHFPLRYYRLFDRALSDTQVEVLPLFPKLFILSHVDYLRVDLSRNLFELTARPQRSRPYTTTLGLPMSVASSTPCAQGSDGFFYRSPRRLYAGQVRERALRA
jgi:hypothetical protein